jgi:hypothetical protein
MLLLLHNDFSHNVYTKGKLGQVFKLMLNILSLGSKVMLKVVMDLLETSMSVVQKYLCRLQLGRISMYSICHLLSDYRLHRRPSTSCP